MEKSSQGLILTGEEPLLYEVEQMLKDTLEFHGTILHFKKTEGLKIFFQGRNRK